MPEAAFPPDDSEFESAFYPGASGDHRRYRASRAVQSPFDFNAIPQQRNRMPLEDLHTNQANVPTIRVGPTRRSKRGHSSWMAGNSSRVRSSITVRSVFRARAGRELNMPPSVDITVAIPAVVQPAHRCHPDTSAHAAQGAFAAGFSGRRWRDVIMHQA